MRCVYSAASGFNKRTILEDRKALLRLLVVPPLKVLETAIVQAPLGVNEMLYQLS